MDLKGGRDMEERVINRDRELSTRGLAQVDDPTAVGADLMAEVQLKAACWEITYKRGDGAAGPTYNGQIGLIRGNRLTASPIVGEKVPKRQKTTDVVEDDPLPPNRWEATPTTALHNVIDYPNKDEFFAVSKIIFANPPTTVFAWSFDDYRRSLTPADGIVLVPAVAGFDTLLKWRSHDVAKAQVAGDPRHLLTKKHLSFERIPDSMWDDIVVGVKIGMVVFRNFDIHASDTGAALSAETLRKLFGEKDSVCVFTGQITKLHNNSARSFEHSINSFRGCSGAIIFLLDKGQPTEEIARHQGKAVGVHVGGKPLTAPPPAANIGFFL